MVLASLAGRRRTGLGQANAPPVAKEETGTLERLRVGEDRPENPGRDPRGSPRRMPVEGVERQFRASKATEVGPPVRSKTGEPPEAAAGSIGSLRGRRGIGKERLRAWDAAVPPTRPSRAGGGTREGGPTTRIARRGEGRETSSEGAGAARIPLMNARARGSSTSSSVSARAKEARASASVAQGRRITGVLKGGITKRR